MDIYPTSTRTPGEGLRAPCPQQLFDNLGYFQGLDDVKITATAASGR